MKTVEVEIIMNEEDVISLFYAKRHFETYEILRPLARKGNKFASYFIGSMLISPIDQTIEPNILLGIDFLKSSAKAGFFYQIINSLMWSSNRF